MNLGMNKINIIRLIEILGFSPLDGVSNVFVKRYSQYDGYTLSIDFNNKKIIYFDKNVADDKNIKVWDNATSNFGKLENFVVLECVDRLLEKGYAPSSLELEKSYPLGKKLKGRLDILVKDLENNPYMLIECKTWGAEFEKEQMHMNRTGGQLFSYYANERVAKYLCLYASKLDDVNVIYKSVIVPIESEWVCLSGTKEIVNAWNGNFKNNGIFEVDKTPYNVKHTALTCGELQNITVEHSNKIFDLIMEILRHNVVSDKPNAFNKLLNLFVCKIIDEDRPPDEVVAFQVLDDDDKYSLQSRLNDLYKEGMYRFLNIRVTDYTENEIETLTTIDDEVKRAELKKAFTKLRLQKNPEFAFVEVCDDKTFDTNNRILREIVELLQGFKFRYAQKHQFLGDFFELLLSTSIKQESGQFFTPLPITRFVLASMPLEQRVKKDVAVGNTDFLPTVIDYACGSGHFLTEYMECMQNIINKVDISKAKPSIQNAVKKYRESDKFAWAKDYVYGIDLDYRLVKTAKVSAFFNGDGEAQIVWANGLGNFSLTDEYSGKLRNISKLDKRDNASFDILISNPPYSVEAFKSILNHGEETFELFNCLSDKSKEIECLFVERMKQLLKPGGWAGIVLPVTLFTNDKIYAKTREILFKYFEIKAIAEMGSATFMKTGTNTVILFLKRRDNTIWQNVNYAVEKFFRDSQDVTVLGIEQPFTKYACEITGKSLDEYITFAKREPEEKILKAKERINSAEKDIIKANEIIAINKKKLTVKNKVIADAKALITKSNTKIAREKEFIAEEKQKMIIEKDKILYFILTYSQIIVLIKAGKKQAEKDFLGYEFSERRGREGLRYLARGGKLFDENDSLNPAKVSSYIYNAFLGNKPMSIDVSVEKYVSYQRLSSLINYNTSVWSKQVFLARKSQEVLSANKNASFVTLKDFCGSNNIKKGTPITAEQAQDGDIKVVAGGMNYAYLHNKCNREANVITISASGNAGYVNLWREKIWASDCITVTGKSDVETLYVYYYLKSIQEQLMNSSYGQIQSHVYQKDVNAIQIPNISFDVQQKIVAECEAVEKNKNAIIKNIERFESEIEELFEKAQSKANGVLSFEDKRDFKLIIGKRVLKDEVLSSGKYPVYSANVNKPFGYLDKLLIDDFSVPSVLWGIDGDWIVVYMPENKPFYPTDHCGVLRVLTDKVHPRYLSWLLEKEGQIQEFSRSRRASIDRMKSLSVSVPLKSVQDKTVKKVFEIEEKIKLAKIDLKKFDKELKQILERYL